MKLHLPLSLRAALLAVMFCLPVAQAANVVKQDGKDIAITELKDSEDGSVEITWDSSRTYLDEKLDGNVTITVSGTGIISLGRGQLGNKDGNININVRDGGRFTLALGDIAYGGGNAIINVESGGILEYIFGTIAYNNMQGEGIKPVQIVLDGGRLECQSGLLAYGTKNRTGAANITVKNHSEFNLSNGLQVGYGFSGGKAVVNLSVEQDGKVTHHGSLGKSDCERDYVKGEDGSYKKDESGNFIPVYSEPGSYDVTINVEGSNAVYELVGGSIGSKENTEKTGIELENKIHITVGQGGLFKQTGGTLAVGDELQKEISVKTGGIFEQTGGDNNADITVTGEYKMTGGTVNGVVSVDEGGNWLLNGGTINGDMTIGTGGVAKQDNGTLSEKSSLTVQGDFTMSKGTINGVVNVEKGGNWLLNDGTINGDMTIGTGGVAKQGNGTISETASLTVQGEFIMSGGVNMSDITIDGGTFSHDAGQIGQAAQEDRVEVTITSGKYEMAGGAVNGVVTVQGDGTFEQTGGDNNADITVTGEYKMTGGAVNGVVNVEKDGNWLLNGGTINRGMTIGAGGVAEQDSGTILETASLTVQGEFTMSGGVNMSGITIDGGTFTHDAGQIGQAAQEGQVDQVEVIIKSGEYTLKGHGELLNAHVTLNGGSFSAEQGSCLTGMTLDVNGGTARMHNSILKDSTVHVAAGGTFTISGPTADVIESTIDLQQGAALKLEENANLSMEELHLTADGSRVGQESGTFTGDIMLEAGTTYDQHGGTVKANRVTVRGSYTLGADGVLTNGEGEATRVDVQAGGSFTQKGTLNAEVNVHGKEASYTQQAGLTGNVVVEDGASFAQGSVITGNVTVQNGGRVERQQGTESSASVSGTVSVDGKDSVFEQGGTINGGVSVTGGASFFQNHDVLGSVEVQNSIHTQESGQISGGVSVNGSGANFTQKGTVSSATPDEIATVVSGGSSVTHEASGTTMGDVELNGDDSRYNLAGTITGDVAVKGGTFTQSDDTSTISQGVSVTGGTYEQQAGKVMGAVVVNGGDFYQSQAEGTVSSIDLQDGTVTQNGTVSGNVSVTKGSYTQNGIVNGTVSVSGGDYTLQSKGTVGGTLTVSGGTVTQQGTTTGLVSVEGGVFHATDDARLNGSLQVSAGSVDLNGNTTISADVNVTGGTVNQQEATLTGVLNIIGGTWEQTAGDHSGSITITGSEAAYDFQGGTISGHLLVDQGASFTLGNGADMSEAMDVTVCNGSSFTIAGTPSGKVSLSLDSARLVAEAAVEVDVTMGGSSSYDMGDQKMSGDILLQGGSLQNASNFAGSLSLETAQPTTGLGGMDAQHLSHIVLMGSRSQITELREDSTLTLREATNTILVTSVNTGDNAQAIVVFDGGKGTVAFGNSGKLVVNFETSLLSSIMDEEGNIDISFLFTNGSFADTDLSDKIVLGSGLEDEKSTGSKTAEGGRVTLHVNAEGIWFASKHQGETDLDDFSTHHKVILDANMNIALNDDDVTVRQLSASTVVTDELTLTVTGDGNHALILENKSSIEGGDNGATIVDGNIVVEGADVKKTGGSKMTISGRITGNQTLAIEEGILELIGKENSFQKLTFGDSGSLILSGDLTLYGDSDWGTSTKAITGGGTLVQEGGSLGMGNIDLTANLIAKGGAEITHGAGTITGNITVDGAASSVTQDAGKVVGNVELSSGGAYKAKNSSAIEGNVIASGSSTTLTLDGSSVTGSVELSDRASMKGGSSDAQITGHVTLGDGAQMEGGEGTITVDSTLTLSGSDSIAKGILAVAGDVTLSGSKASFTAEKGSSIGGHLILSASTEATYSGTLTGGAQVSGEGAHLTLSTGAEVGEVQLSGAQAMLTLAGTAVVEKVLVTGSGAQVDLQGFGGEGTLIELETGLLTRADDFTGDVKIDTHEGGEVKLGNLHAENITQVHVHSADGVYYTGLADGSTLTFTGTDNMITVGRDSVGIGTKAEKSVFSFNGSGSIKFAEGAQVTLQFESAVYEAFASGELELWFSNGNFNISGVPEEQILEWAKQHFLLPTGSGFEFSYFSDVQEGDARLTITARTDSTSKVLTPDETLSTKELEGASKVVIETDTTLSSDEEEATVWQLEGKGNLTVQSNVDMELKLRNENFVNDGVQNYDGNTVFSGDIDATQSEGIVDIVKEGDASLELSGHVKTNGNIQVSEGILALSGTAEVNSVQTETDSVLDVTGELILRDKTTLDKGTLLSSNHSGEMTIKDRLTLGSDLKLENGGPAMNVGESGVLTVDGGDLQLAALSGSGTLKAGKEGSVTISGNNTNKGNFCGTIDGSVQELLITGSGTEQTFTNVKAEQTKLNVFGNRSKVMLYGGSFKEFESQGTVVLKQDTVVTVDGSVHLSNSSLTEFNVQANQLTANAMLVSGGTISLESGADITVHLIGEVPAPTEGLNIVLMQGKGVAVDDNMVTANGELSSLEVIWDEGMIDIIDLYYENVRVEALLLTEDSQVDKATEENGMTTYAAQESRAQTETQTQVLLKADLKERDSSNNLLINASGSSNSQAGANMLYNAAYSTTITPELLELVGHVTKFISDGKIPAAQHAMAAVAGSVIPALGAAQRDAAKRQISATVAHAFALSYEMPFEKTHTAHVWVEGNGGVTSMDRSGDESGYEHRTWGASCGADMALSKKTAIGVSLTASYGDWEADAADHADGDLDNIFVSLYLHTTNKRLHHSFGVVAGFADASFNRTVNMDGLSYRTTGDTDGISLGASYELAYDIPLNEEKDSILQPLVGISVVTSSMDAYNEGGAGGIGLHVDDQKSTVTTLTAGARSINNLARALGFSSMLELRANIAIDMGDDRGEADVSFLGNPGYAAKVRSAELGSVGAQFGAGLRIPMSKKSVLFINGDADFRSGSTTWGANVGVQWGF